MQFKTFDTLPPQIARERKILKSKSQATFFLFCCHHPQLRQGGPDQFQTQELKNSRTQEQLKNSRTLNKKLKNFNFLYDQCKKKLQLFFIIYWKVRDVRECSFWILLSPPRNFFRHSKHKFVILEKLFSFSVTTRLAHRNT